MKLYGTNLSQSACAPSFAQADKLATFIASLCLILCLLSFAAQAAPIPSAKINNAIGLAHGWLNNVTIEILIDPPTITPQKRYVGIKWSEIDDDGIVTPHCKIGAVDNLSVIDFLYGKGPQSLGYALYLWMNALPENTNPWCVQ